jgi:hypothetical protein
LGANVRAQVHPDSNFKSAAQLGTAEFGWRTFKTKLTKRGQKDRQVLSDRNSKSAAQFRGKFSEFEFENESTKARLETEASFVEHQLQKRGPKSRQEFQVGSYNLNFKSAAKIAGKFCYQATPKARLNLQARISSWVLETKLQKRGSKGRQVLSDINSKSAAQKAGFFCQFTIGNRTPKARLNLQASFLTGQNRCMPRLSSQNQLPFWHFSSDLPLTAYYPSSKLAIHSTRSHRMSTEKLTLTLTGIDAHIQELQNCKWAVIHRLANNSYNGQWRQEHDLQFAAKIGRLAQALHETSIYHSDKVSEEVKGLLAEFSIREISTAMSPTCETNDAAEYAAGLERAQDISNLLLLLDQYPTI